MSQFIGIRAFNRSQAVRIGGKTVKSVTSTGDLAPITYIDLEDKVARKELAYHSAIGAVYTCTAVQTHSYAAGVVQTNDTNGGLKVSEGTSATDLTLAVAAGVVRADTGDTYTKTAATVTIGTAPGTGFKRIDLVSFKISDQTYVVTPGDNVANATTLTNTLANAKPVPTGHIPLATVLVESGVTGLADAKVADARVFA